MRKPLILILSLVAIIYACNQQGKKSPNTLLNTGKLGSQIFTVDITRDTTLKTKRGANIKIPKGALKADISIIQLQIKEAYNFRDIVRAGLVTKAGENPLSSGGMIYINAVGEANVTITQAISISLPTPYIDTNMSVYKGVVKDDSTVDWTDPKPLADKKMPAPLQTGAQIFADNCSRCHSISKDLVGPALANITYGFRQEGRSSEVFAFTKSPAKVLASGDIYFNCLYEKWNRAPMPEFPDLTNTQLHMLYDYIENESKRLAIPLPENDMLDCFTKCREYKSAQENLEAKRDSLIFDNQPPVKIDSPSPQNISRRNTALEDIDLVSPSFTARVYYQFDITSFGWYNIDLLLKDIPGLQETTLTVRIQGEYREQLRIYLAVPSIRMLSDGGLLKDKEDEYGFFTKDGKIPLPLGAKGYIIAMHETSDSIQYGLNIFTINAKQQFELPLKNSTIDEFNKVTRSLGFDNLSITAAETKNATAIRQIDTALANLAPPPICDCICNRMAPKVALDTAFKE